jgi:hypothetical protein
MALAIPAAAQAPVAAKPDDAAPVTRTYDLKPLLVDRAIPGNVHDAEAVARLILDQIDLGELKPGSPGNQLLELDGQRIQVRAPAKIHEEISDFLGALQRLNDIAVDVKASLVELDAATFEKELKPHLKPAAGNTEPRIAIALGMDTDGREDTQPPVSIAETLTKLGLVIQSSDRLYHNGLDATVLVRQQYFSQPQALNAGPKVMSKDCGKVGVRLNVTPVVSADRRFIRLKMTEQTAAIDHIRTRKLGEIAGGQPLVESTVFLDEAGKTAAVEVADCGAAIFKLGYAPKDKVWIAILRPTIIIKAEQEAEKK